MPRHELETFYKATDKAPVCAAVAVATADPGTRAGLESVAETELGLMRDRFFVRASQRFSVESARKECDGTSANSPHSAD
jgi:hypothetical protein